MDIELVPVVDAQLPLRAAFATMRQSGRSAVVVRQESSYWLAEAPAVVIGMHDPISMLGELQARTILGVLSFTSPRGVLDFHDPKIGPELEHHLASLPYAFTILVLTASSALLASRIDQDMQRRVRASPRDCYCKTDRKDVTPGATGGDCPHDPSHRGTVRCV